MFLVIHVVLLFIVVFLLRFQQWFGALVETLEPGSVVVMDNAPYHSVVVPSTRTPTSAWKEKDIQEWLDEKGIH